MIHESINFKAEQFFGKNWKFIFWGLMLTILVMTYELHLISDRMQTLEKVVYDNNSKVVVTTIDGRVIRVEKEPLKAEYLQQFVISTLVNNFIVSRASLTNNFKKTSFTQYSEILENSQGLANIYKNYLGNPSENKQAFGDFTSYLQWILSAIAQDKLPEYIDIKNYKVSNYVYKGNSFNIQLEIQVALASYIIAKNEYVNQVGTIKINASGDFDLQRATDFNPYGMRIIDFNIIIPTKMGKEDSQ